MSAPVRLQGGKRRGRTALKALSTVLIGEDATQVAALDEDGDALRSWQLAALGWHADIRTTGQEFFYAVARR